MVSQLNDRKVTFSFKDGCLVRTVTGAGDQGYPHWCGLKAYEAVAHAIEETPVDGEGVMVGVIAIREAVVFTQVIVAVEFLLDRGIVEARDRRIYPVGNGVHLDAMIEWHALAERNRQDLDPTLKGA